MSFTARHYNEVAAIIRGRLDIPPAVAFSPEYMQGRADCARQMMHDLGRMFAADNPRFDIARFNLNCEPGVITPDNARQLRGRS